MFTIRASRMGSEMCVTEQSLCAAEPFRAMLAEMEGFLARQQKAELAHLTDPFGERMAALAKVVGSAVRTELGLMSPRPGGED